MQPDTGLLYLYGGRCRVSFLNVLTGNRFTYEIKKSKHDDKVHYVLWVKSPNNDRSKKVYLGAVFNFVSFKMTTSSTLSRGDMPLEAFMYVFVLLVKKKVPKNIHIFNHGFCSNCGRSLSDPESIRTGLGPTCRVKIQKIIKKNNLDM